MNEALSWLAIVGAGGGGSIITFITFWMALSSRITRAESQAKSAEERAKDADSLAITALNKHENLVRDINDSRVDIMSRITALDAVTHANTTALTQAETRLAKSIEDMGEKIDHLSDTLIKTLSEMIAVRKNNEDRNR